MKKWRNVRDLFRKSHAKNKEAKKSGAGAKSLKTYIYESQLQFLGKIFQGRETDETLSQDFEHADGVEFINENDGQNSQNQDETQAQISKNVFKQPRPPAKHK